MIISGEFAQQLWKVAHFSSRLSVCLSVCLSVRIEQLDFHQTDFRQIMRSGFSLKYSDTY